MNNLGYAKVILIVLKSYLLFNVKWPTQSKKELKSILVAILK